MVTSVVLAAVQVLEKMDLNKQFNIRSQKQSTEGTVAKKLRLSVSSCSNRELQICCVSISTGMRRAVQNIF
jgi:hypothetical protein